MGGTDAILARLTGELEERTQFMDSLVEAAEKESRDLNEQEMDLLKRTRERITIVNGQIEPLRDAARIASESRSVRAQIAQQFLEARDPSAAKPFEYRSAGEYINDVWRARLGNEQIAQRLELYERAAAHQTTTDNPGLLPTPIVAPVINFVDQSRPSVQVFGPRQLPNGSWSRPKVTQHTQVGAQSAEKGELVSRKMVIGKLPVTAVTYGGYVNVSRQNADWTQPQVMDIIITDLAGQYAIETENAFIDALVAGATAGPTLPTGANTKDQVAAALWTAAGSVFGATKGQGRVVAITGVDMLGLLGPMFPPVNPQDAQSTGFEAVNFSTGAVGNIAGIPFYVSAGIAANTILVASTAAAEAYEDRIGSLQVIEPSVLGIQVAYAGYFASLIVEALGLQKIVKTP